MSLVFKTRMSQLPYQRIVVIGTTSSGKRVTHVYHKPGTYIAKVNITDSKGYSNLLGIEYVINVSSAGAGNKQ